MSITAPSIQVGGATSNPGTLLLSPNFFDQGGFASFTLSGIGAESAVAEHYVPGVFISPGTHIAPAPLSTLADLEGGGVALTTALLDESLRSPVSLTFNALGARDSFSSRLTVRGDFLLAAGAGIQAGPNGSVTIGGDTVTVLGSIRAPGGSITITGAKSFAATVAPTVPLPTVDLGPHSSLSTAGMTLLTPDSRGFRTGSVLNGGSIRVSGNIVAESGARLDVSGASDRLDLAPSSIGLSPQMTPYSLTPLMPARVDSNGGSIALQGAQELFTDATLIGRAGGPSALGGSLTVSSGRFLPPDVSTLVTPLDPTLVVTQNGPVIPAPFYQKGQPAVGSVVLDPLGHAVPGLGYFAVNRFTAGGFDSLTLPGTVRFFGPVNLSARGMLRIADNGVILADNTVSLHANYAYLGSAFQPPAPAAEIVSAYTVAGQPFYFPPTHGPGQIAVQAHHIDIGNLSLQNIGSASFIAANGDIRGDGTLDVAGNLSMRAGQIYPPTGVAFTIAAYDYVTGGKTHPGSVTLAAGGQRDLPLSAGGRLNVYASSIFQGGVLRAPIGEIDLGWNGSGSAPIDLASGLTVNATQQLTLSRGSVTSVSAVDPHTGRALIIPYGLDLNGISWIDPTGADITLGGVPAKTIHISAVSIDDQHGSTIDIRGGGDLVARRWVSGLGGTRDILASTSSFAVLPDYQADYAPYAPFNNNPAKINLNSDPGYVNSAISSGDRIFLNAGAGLAAGYYTLLPARYALLPGAFLVTPRSGLAPGSFQQTDGSALVSGYRYNDLNVARAGALPFSTFEVAPLAMVVQRAQYDSFSANAMLQNSALKHDLVPPRLPIDSGQLVFTANRSMNIRGSLKSRAPAGGLGGLVDISSPSAIRIESAAGPAPAGTLLLDSAGLTAFGADSLLIGGYRQIGSKGTSVTVTTDSLTLDNPGAPLAGPDVILVSNKTLAVTAQSIMKSSGAINKAPTLLLGASDPSGNPIVGSGDGVLMRVSADTAATSYRTGVSASTAPAMTIGAGATITGASITLDSTYATSLEATARLRGRAISLDSGQISLQLDRPGALDATGGHTTAGLVLSSAALRALQPGLRSLSLLSYSSLDTYGSGIVGGRSTLASLALQAGEIRGFNTGAAGVTFAARDILIANEPAGSGVGIAAGATGPLTFEAATIRLGANQTAIDQYSSVALNASGGILLGSIPPQQTSGFPILKTILPASGALSVRGGLTLTTPLIAGLSGASETITTLDGGALAVNSPAGNSHASISTGLGVNLTLQGARVTADSAIVLPAGRLTLHATSGDVVVRGRLAVEGVAHQFHDLAKYASAGQIDLVSDIGNVTLAPGSRVSLAAASGGGDGGTLTIGTPNGAFSFSGNPLAGQGGSGGQGGVFLLDTARLASLSALDATLNAGGFTESRSFRVRQGDVLADGAAAAHVYNLSADQGSIAVTGKIDASGEFGGSIDLAAYGSITLQAGSLLTVHAHNFSHAGTGGTIWLQAGAPGFSPQNVYGHSATASLDIRAGSILDLRVDAYTPASPDAGNFTGMLHLRAPQTASNTDLQMSPLEGTVLGASSIGIEGYQLFDLTASGGLIDAATQSRVHANATTFGHSAGDLSTPGSIVARLLAGNPGLQPVTVIEPGAEIVNRTGNLTLGTATSTASANWDLSGYRFGPKLAPGVLTLRAANNLVFLNALSDGFTSSSYTAPLLPYNPLLPANTQSWSFRMTSGADFTAADFHRVRPLSSLAVSNGTIAGSLLLGKNDGLGLATSPGLNATTASAIGTKYFQVIRTGAGGIDISAGGDVRLLNQFAAVYTAGSQIPDATMGGNFEVPMPSLLGSQSTLGAIQEQTAYPAQYTRGGGSVTIAAQGSIQHLTLNSSGALIADSERELPINWLFRRGYVNPATGRFGVSKYGEIASTSWWVDFSNFFEGVGALGGGNVTFLAGRDVSNVDAVAPTNARMPKGTPNPSSLVELGGGDVLVRAGHDIDGGVYYVERGRGTLAAGNTIHTNSTRSPSLGNITIPSDILPSQTWLPTTLFLGKGGFNVSAHGDLLLGPVANPFLLPEGYSNTYWYKTYFSTYAPDNFVNVSSLTGSVLLREGATMPGASNATPILQNWLQRVNLLVTNPFSVSYYQPWLRLDETSVAPFGTVSALLPSTLRATAFLGDIDLAGSLTLAPSPTGTIDLVAGGSINALQITGVSKVDNLSYNSWESAKINLSDANPATIPGIGSPLAYQGVAGIGTTQTRARVTGVDFLKFIDTAFGETGATQGADSVLQARQALHTAGLLHAGDPVPVHLYSEMGDISGLTLYSAKTARVVAGRDLTDIALYIQNLRAKDITVVAAGRDITAYDANSPLRVAAIAGGNVVNFGSETLAGDVQIGGPGTLELLAGRDLDLGVGPNNANGTGLGVTTIGNARNPYLPFAGSDIVAAAGIGTAFSLENSKLDFKSFATKFLAGANSSRYFPELDAFPGLTAKKFKALPSDEQSLVGIDLFYLVLRDAGRDRNTPGSAGYGNYDAGYSAIATLFPGGKWTGDISLTSREIKTAAGGSIGLLAPGGQLTVGFDISGNQAVDQGILTEAGGDISIFTHGSVTVGTSRIFTLRGGNEIIWSSVGDIAAGSSSKTVQSAPPTRVLIDPQSGDVKTDLAGLATGGGIGVLDTVAGVPPGNVDLIAPKGVVDAGDAGIRVSGNLNISAATVLNAGNIQTGGATIGAPAVTISSVSTGGLTVAANAPMGNGAAAAAQTASRPRTSQQQNQEQVASLITVEVVGYGGEDDETGAGIEEPRKRNPR